MSQPKIALISSGLGRVRRGIETWIGELARNLHPRIDVELWGAARLDGWPCPTVASPTISRLSWTLRSASWGTRYHIEQMSAVLPTVLRLRRRRIDLAFCGDPSLAWNLKRFRRFHGARVVFTDGMRLTPRWLQEYDGIHLLAPRYLEEAASVVRPENLSRFFVVPYFVEIDRFRPPVPGEKDALRAEFGIPRDALVAMTVGPVGRVSGKRLDHVVKEVAAAGPRWRLVSAGGDEDGAEAVRGQARQALGDRVQFLGAIPRSRLESLYRTADCYILGALAEPFSIAILEAIASELPVVHHPDPITCWVSGGGGIPISMETDGAAAGVLNQLANDPGMRARLGTAGRELACRRNDPDVVSDALAARFRAICANPRAR